jgi:hypothetical protein
MGLASRAKAELHAHERIVKRYVQWYQQAEHPDLFYWSAG